MWGRCKITQEDVVEFLRRNSPKKFTADELQRYLDLGAGLYENLKRLMPTCRHCEAPLRGSVKVCVDCGADAVFIDGFRSVYAPHRRDRRKNVVFYWYENGND